MNKRFVLAQLAKIANELDRNNLFSEANDVTDVMRNVEKKPFNPRADPFGEMTNDSSSSSTYYEELEKKLGRKPGVVCDMYGCWLIDENNKLRGFDGSGHYFDSEEFGRKRDEYSVPKPPKRPPYSWPESIKIPKPQSSPIDLGPFLPDLDIESYPEQNPSAEEGSGSPSTNAVVEQSLDEDVIVRYPGPTGKRHVIEWNVKTPAWPGQEITVDWENNRLLKILKTDEFQKRQNLEMMKMKPSKIKN